MIGFDFVNLLAIVSGAITVFVVYKMAHDIFSVKGKREEDVDVHEDKRNIEYKKILEATHWLEHERQRNKGEHFDDETVYLNRAKSIRTSTSFFSYVNE